MTRPLLIEGAREIATLAGGLRRGDTQDDLALLRSAAGDLAVACDDGRILAVGGAAEVRADLESSGRSLGSFDRIDAAGGTVTPGLIDSHTHLLFAGSREAEWQLRARGAGYIEILAAGRGILSTVSATRAASDDALLAHGRRWLGEMLRHGTTTVEAKSGYGLNVESELHLLELAGRLGTEGPAEVLPTWLGAHAIPTELRGRTDAPAAYLDSLLHDQLPAVVSQGIARFADVFCEPGVFGVDETRRIVVAAREVGLSVRLHCDELEPSGGVELATDPSLAGAVRSVDHLDAITSGGVSALAAAAAGPNPVVATLLPGASWFLMHRRYPPARDLIAAGVPVALATDFNPGTAPIASLALVMSIACIEMRMTPAEALAAVTVNAARSLGVEDRLGSIEPGKQADLVIWKTPSAAEIPYWVGADLVQSVVKRGIVVQRPRTLDGAPRR